MQYYNRRSGILFCEDLSLHDLGERFATPLYLYSETTILSHLKRFQDAFKLIDHKVCYAVKANSHGAILKLMARHGVGADVVSLGELRQALRSGIPAPSIVFSGVGKDRGELQASIEAGIGAIQIESLGELLATAELAKSLGRVARIGLRVNPDIEVITHPKIATGLHTTKFGIEESSLAEALAIISHEPALKLVGMSTHLGSQITSVEPYVEAAERLLAILNPLRERFPIEYMSLGGGFAVDSTGSLAPDPSVYAEAVLPIVEGKGLRLHVEPGRALVAGSGVLLTKVLYTKATPKKNFVIVDASMTELIRPTLYEAEHPVELVDERTTGETLLCDVVGPVCETGDFLALDRELRIPEQGECIAIRCAGAYGSAMSSNYNSRPRPAEVLVSGSEAKLISRRETFEDLIAREL